MTQAPRGSDGESQLRLLPHAPEELTEAPLIRLAEGVGRVIYASRNWVVKRERSPSAIIALIVLWKVLRRLERMLPGGLGRRLLQRPARQIRFLRVLLQPLVLAIPKSLWYMTHVGQVWKLHRARDARGESLAQAYLAGTRLVPERVAFPPTRVRVGGWPGWLTVSEATRRVDATLHQRLSDLARAGRFEELELWLDRFLELRQAGWRRGLFSVDAHLKNFGVSGDRVVLLDTGGLTDNWAEVEGRLAFEDVVAQPHIQLGLGPMLGSRPDIADRFNARWRAIVTRSGVLRHWPGSGD